MRILPVETKKDEKALRAFRRALYRGDPYYVSTAEFTPDMLLRRETAFAKGLTLCPVMGVEGDRILMTALLIHNPGDDFLQLSCFEAVEGVGHEVPALVDYARAYAAGLGLSRVVIGLNGHLSYGVGLSLGMSSPNTFDSTYTKPYYADYFGAYPRRELVAFSGSPAEVLPALGQRASRVTVRPFDPRRFEEEMESFRLICDETIGETYLYSPTRRGHFCDLLKPMRFFLRPENILFAEDGGQVVGFLFWHPDYNEVLKKGRPNSLPAIALRYLLRGRRIRRAKLNAMGVKAAYRGPTTIRLLCEAGKYMEKYETVETNFVWCHNKPSMALNGALLGHIERRFAVYEVEV